jgi:stage IV sporulation protein FB
MNRSLKLLTVKGIDIRLHITFPLILIWAAFQFGQMFGSLMPVKQIILSPIGGVAQLMRMPDKPAQELVIAIAGPAVNILMAFLMLALAAALGIDFGTLFSAATGLALAGATLLALFSYVFVSNIFLAVFNLIPAFPMDGGRILRALLALRLDYARATKLAANVGRVFAVLFGIYGLINGNFFLIMIAIFIFGAATQESRSTKVRHILRGHTVQQAFSSSSHRLEAAYTLQQAANMATYSRQRSFPVVSGDRLVGFLPQTVLRDALRTYPAHTPISAVMRTNVRPVTPQTDLYVVQERLQAEKLDALPVVSDTGRLLGMITNQQIAELFRLVQSEPPIMTGSQSV